MILHINTKIDMKKKMLVVLFISWTVFSISMQNKLQSKYLLLFKEK